MCRAVCFGFLAACTIHTTSERVGAVSGSTPSGTVSPPLSGSSGGTNAAGGSSEAGGSSGAGGTTGSIPSGGTGGTADGGAGSYGGGNPEIPYDWVGIIGTGQSLSVGWQASAISTTQPYHNLKLEDDGPDPKYPIDATGNPQWSVVPLTEPIRFHVAGSGAGYDDEQYPNDVFHSGTDYTDATSYGESPHSGMGNTLSAIWNATGKTGEYVTAHTVVGYAGNPLTNLDKEGMGRAYPASLHEVGVWKTLAAQAGKTYGVAGIVLTHGEADAANPNYGTQLAQFWQDYNTDIKALTGQASDVVLFASQQSSSSGAGNSAVQLWQAGMDHPGEIIVTGPKYQYGAYGLHMQAPGYNRIGEKYAEVFDLVVNQKVPWKPLGPSRITRSGAVITITMDVPNPPLQWDTHLVAPHQSAHTAWAAGLGFEVTDGAANELTIASVAIQEQTVALTLAATPAVGTALTVSYAVTADDTTNGYQGGLDTGPHGQLRDSDGFIADDVETIATQVTHGSDQITDVNHGDFARRAALDVVTGADVPDNTVMTPFYDGATLSQPWAGATGTVMWTYHHDHHNYCVHFSMSAP